MVIFKHELRQGRISLLVWTAVIACMMGVCILIFPEMSDEIGGVSDVFASMGSFSAAFGMDRLNFGELIGFFGVECGNVLGLGGAFFAALTGVSALAKEEREGTAEFLLTHPVSRIGIIAEKLCAVAAQVLALNLVCIAVTALSVWYIDGEVPVKTVGLLFLAYFLMQLEVAAVTFGISAFLRRGGLGIGLGLAALFYFMNIVANLTDKAAFLKYLTPFGYTESADIIADNALQGGYLAVGAAMAAVGVALAFLWYGKKDIA